MTVTVFGRVVDHSGLAHQIYAVQGRYTPEIRHSFYQLAAGEFRRRQPGTICLDLDHDEVVGEVVYLEQAAGGLMAVATSERDDLEDLARDRDVFFSPSTDATVAGHDIELTGLALCCQSALIGQRPVTVLPGDLRAATEHVRLHRRDWGLVHRLERAAAYRSRRRFGDPHLIAVDPDHAAATDGTSAEVFAGRALARSRLEVRSVADVDVDRRQRVIEIIAAPHDVETTIYEPHRSYRESFVRGAFAGCEQRVERIRVNRDHDVQRLVGRAVRLDPHAFEGLVADLKIARTPLGDETLELAGDGCLDASVGFAIPAGGDTWSHGQTRRRVTRAHLDHVALVPAPAYETANVLAVRHLAMTH